MKHLTILVDMDDTIENLLAAWASYLNHKYGTDVDPNDIDSWDIYKSFPTLTKSQVYEPLFVDAFWYCVKPKDDASDALQKLIADGHTVLIVTSSTHETLSTKMTAVLFKYFPFFTWNDVIITSKKQLIRGDVLVDDGVHNLENGEYEKILFDAPHNRGYDAEANGMTRVHNWSEAYAAINKLAQQ